MQLSIITPYFNCAKEFSFLYSILAPQLTEETEWIVVNDGSSLPSLTPNPHVRIINREKNSGNASLPRNVGLNDSQGAYISFIDADDQVSNDYVSSILAYSALLEEDVGYFYFSWAWSRGQVVITEDPPTWNTSVWNCVYRKSLIGDIRFDVSLNIAEDEMFNKKVRKGKHQVLLKCLYRYNDNRRESLTSQFRNKEIPSQRGDSFRNPRDCGILLYIAYIAPVGGIETFLLNFCNTFYTTYDILIVYGNTSDPSQVMRLKGYVRCLEDDERSSYTCDKYICVSNYKDISSRVTSRDSFYASMIHADYKAMSWKYKKNDKTTLNIAVSDLAKTAVLEQCPEIPCITIYNLLNLYPIHPILRLISATRLTAEKGAKNMEKFSEQLQKRGVNYLWINFTDDVSKQIKGIITHDRVYNIVDYMKDADFFVSLSDTESYGYSMVEALSAGVPIVVKNIPILKELGIKNEKHGYILSSTMSNMNEVIDLMLTHKGKRVRYKKIDSPLPWIRLLGKGNVDSNRYKGEKTMYLVRATNEFVRRRVMDSQLRRVPGPGETWVVDKERLAILTAGIQYVELVKELEDPTPVIAPISVPEEPEAPTQSDEPAVRTKRKYTRKGDKNK